MGHIGRMGRMVMGLWDEGTILWGTMGLWDGSISRSVAARHAPRTAHRASGASLNYHTLAKARRGAG
jgi:hypothetical protein